MNTGVGRLFLFEGIFLTQESNRGPLHCRRIVYHLSYQGSPNPCRLMQLLPNTTEIPVSLLCIFLYSAEINFKANTQLYQPFDSILLMAFTHVQNEVQLLTLQCKIFQNYSTNFMNLSFTPMLWTSMWSYWNFSYSYWHHVFPSQFWFYFYINIVLLISPSG